MRARWHWYDHAFPFLTDFIVLLISNRRSLSFCSCQAWRRPGFSYGHFRYLPFASLFSS
jgi:hypothetical protein